MSKYGFYFEKAGLGATQGAIAPAEQFFEGTAAEESLAREFGQNSLDAVADIGEPVRMKFELRRMATEDVPAIDGLREHLRSVVAATERAQGNDRMVKALATAEGDELMVLRVSDFGTKGLGGSESIRDNTSALSALTRGAGVSANDGTRGGSFGIGSAVGPLSSDLSTVFYSSLPLGQHQVVFAGHARLATHKDEDGVLRNGDGFFTDLTQTDDFRYLRTLDAFGPFEPRVEVGTDIHIMGYRKAEEDPGLEHIRAAFIEHFMVAIHRGRLIVEGETEVGSWRLDAASLPDEVRGVGEAEAFYRAVLDPAPIEWEHPELGALALRVNIDDSLPKSLHTVTMRRPLMKIDTFRFTSIPVRYAAVLECVGAEGNKILRDLEPPQHDKWDGGRRPGGAALVSQLKKWVREGIRSKVAAEVGETVEVKGLARYLPADGLTVRTRKDLGGLPGMGDGTKQESSTVQGRPVPVPVTPRKPRRSVGVPVQVQGGPPGDGEARSGKESGGGTARGSKGGDLEGSAGEGSGNARISGGDVRFRSWARPGGMTVSLTAHEDISGDLELLAIGVGGTGEADYALPITGVTRDVDGTSVPLKWSGNSIKDLDLVSGQPIQLNIGLVAGLRYRLDVK